MARNDSPKKHNPIINKYPDVTHLKAEDGGPLCRTNGVNAKKITEAGPVTCNSCNKRAKRR
jgi:hypothetical protein